MAKTLVVVESPAKARTINRYLGKDYKVVASMGHIRDLPKTKLGVDVEAGFSPAYEPIPARKKVIKELKDAAKGVSRIFVATDPDREGEAIGWHLVREVGGKKMIGRLMGVYSATLLLVSLMPTALGLTGFLYLVGAFLLGVGFLWRSFRAWREMSRRAVRRVFLGSLAYQPLLLGLMVLDTVRQ